MGGVAFHKVTLRDAMKGEDELVEVVFFKGGTGGFNKRFNVSVFLVVRWEKGRFEVGRVLANRLHEVHNRSFITGHGVVRIHRHNEEVVDALLEQFKEGALSRGIAVAHAEFGGEAGALGKGGLLFAGSKNEGGAFGFPDTGVGFCGLFGPLGEDEAIYDKPTNELGGIKNTLVHKELPKVVANVVDLG